MSIQDVVAVLQGAIVFVWSREFAINFFANLGGALIGVWLAFWIERLKVRGEKRDLYGSLLNTSRSELSYLRPRCEKAKEQLKAGKRFVPLGSLSVPATKALLVNPLVHEKAPPSLFMALTILSADSDSTEEALRRAQALSNELKLSPEAVVLYRWLGGKVGSLADLMVIVLEELQLELKRLGIKVTVDPRTQEVSRRLVSYSRSGLRIRDGKRDEQAGKEGYEESAEGATRRQEGAEGSAEADAIGVGRLAPSATRSSQEPRVHLKPTKGCTLGDFKRKRSYRTQPARSSWPKSSGSQRERLDSSLGAAY